MKLRLRLALTTLAVAVPMLLGVWLADAVSRHRAAEVALAEFTRMHMLGRGRERCEADPTHWGGEMPRPPGPGPGEPERGPPHGHDAPPAGPRDHGDRPPRARHDGRVAPPQLHAYDLELHAANPAAPRVPAELAARLGDDELATWRWAWWSPEVEVLVRMPWATGPCAIVLARGNTVPGWLGAILPATSTWLVPLVALFAVVLAAMGPIVRRIRRLTAEVRRSAETGYASPVALSGRDELAELARAFAEAGQTVRAELAEKDRREQALRRFLADTTHDVMIPLTVLQGHLSALRERAGAGQAPELPTLIAAMDEAHYIAALVHNLALAARLDAGALQLQRGPVDLCALVERVVMRHRPIARQHAVSLERATPEAPIFADADVTLLEQAVSNLVYNAIRHHRSDGHVALILDSHDAGAHFRVRVVDDGPGIPADELARIAERGVRGNQARTRAPEGQGLGLDIVHRVAALHGYSLHLQASEFGGLQVDLAGPCAAP
ncbi:MAG: HAMP domain-containing histidine kinase [Myxococcales bacterium]|nr:HAMP domain-containing histidine kinase [Myxococcales bacterium]